MIYYDCGYKFSRCITESNAVSSRLAKQTAVLYTNQSTAQKTGSAIKLPVGYFLPTSQ